MSQHRGPPPKPGASRPVPREAIAELQRFLEKTARSAPGTVVVRRPETEPAPKLEIGYVVVLPVSSSNGLFLQVVQRIVDSTGHPGPWDEFPLSRARIAACPDKADRAVLTALLDATESTASNAVLADAKKSAVDVKKPRPSRFSLSRAARERILPMLCRTGRCRLRRKTDERGTPLLGWSEVPWQVRLEVTIASTDNGDDWDVTGVLRRNSERATLDEIEFLFEGGLAIVRGEAGRIDDGGASSWFGMLREHPRVRVTAARRAAFLEELYGLPVPPPVELPGGLRLGEITVPPRPRLYLPAPDDESAQLPHLNAELHFDYDGFLVAARKAGKVAFDPARTCLIRRDAASESAARARLAELGVVPAPSTTRLATSEGPLQLPALRLPTIVSTLVAEGWQVEAAGRRYRRPSAFQANLRSGSNWFDLKGAFQFDGITVSLTEVIEALRRGDTAVPLGDGTLGMLPEEWLSRHGIVARLAEVHQGALRFQASQAALVEALVAEEPGIHVDAAFSRAREAIANAKITPADPPEGFRGALRAYQREGLGWMRFLQESKLGGCLADEMGLGKTVQILALLLGRKGIANRPSLVVAPRSLIFNWKQEAARFAPALRVLDHTGDNRKTPGAHFDLCDLVLTTYGTLRRDIDALADYQFDCVVLDEAQAIKNDASDTSKAARRLRAGHRLALSGTPVENHLGELWALFEFLNPGLLGKAATFKAAAAARAGEGALSTLSRALRPFLLRRTKARVASDLPERLEATRMCELEPAQRTLYEELRLHYRGELHRRVKDGGLAKARVHVLEALLRLRQAACHPALIDPSRRGERSAKLDLLFDELPMVRDNGQKALVFSQFTTLLGLVRDELDARGIRYEYLDGKTRDRQSRVERFQSDPDCSVFLISLKAGGVGLNLTAAEYVFLLDPWWNPAAEAQAIDRAHRIGQTRSVFAYRLIAKDTIEERIAQLQSTKRALAESVIEGDGGVMKDLSVEDLDLLLS